MLIACTQRGDESGHVGMPLQTPSEKEQPINLAARSKIPLRPALPFPRPLLPLPDNVHTARNTSAISL